jgi:hypothetical protein
LLFGHAGGGLELGLAAQRRHIANPVAAQGESPPLPLIAYVE